MTKAPPPGAIVYPALLGAYTLSAQALLLRELAALWGGREWILASALSIWLLAAAAGSIRGGARPWTASARSGRYTALVVLGLLLPAGLLWLRAQALFVSAGIDPGPWAILVWAFPILAALSAWPAYIWATWASRPEAGAAGSAYRWEAVGAAVGGLTTTLACLQGISGWAIAAVWIATLGVTGTTLAWMAGARREAGLTLALGLLGVPAVGLWPLEVWSGQWLIPGGGLRQSWPVPSGQFRLAGGKGQENLYHNGVWVAGRLDPEPVESLAHFTLSRHPAPRVVLVIGGTAGGLVEEAARHRPFTLQALELDAATWAVLESQGLAPQDNLAQRQTGDAGRYLDHHRHFFDAILMPASLPLSLSENRSLTEEYFRRVRDSLRPGGVFGLDLPGPGNYPEAGWREAFSSIGRSLQRTFPNVLAVPGARVVLVASERPLQVDGEAVWHRRGIAPLTLRPGDLAGRLEPGRQALLDGLLAAPAPANREALPVAFLAGTRHWLARHGLSSGAMGAAVLLVMGGGLGLILRAPRPALHGVTAATGFGGILLSMAGWLAFQTAEGALPVALAWLGAAFMAGSAWGSSPGDTRALFKPALALAVLSMAAACLWWMEAPWNSTAWRAPLNWLTATVWQVGAGWLTGRQFVSSSHVLAADGRGSAGFLYATEAVGAGLGALVLVFLLLPRLGLAGALAISAGLQGLAWWLARRESSRVEPVGAGMVAAPSGSLVEGWCLWPLAVAAALAGLAIFERGSTWLSAVTLSRPFLALCLAAIAWEMAGLVWPARLGPPRRMNNAGNLGRSIGRLPRSLALGLFGLVVLLPLVRCYFFVPWLFCHVCPRRCVFGLLRPYLIPAALLANTFGRRWCSQSCPLGVGQDGLHANRACHCGSGAVRRTGRLYWASLAVILAVALAYWGVREGYQERAAPTGDWFTAVFRNAYAVQPWTLAIGGAGVIFAFVLRRWFCYGCPVGATSDLISRLTRSAARSGRLPQSDDRPHET